MLCRPDLDGLGGHPQGSPRQMEDGNGTVAEYVPMQMIEERGTAGLEREHMLCHGGIGGGEYGKAREGVSFRPGMTLAEGGKCTNCAAVSRRRA